MLKLSQHEPPEKPRIESLEHLKALQETGPNWLDAFWFTPSPDGRYVAVDKDRNRLMGAFVNPPNSKAVLERIEVIPTEEFLRDVQKFVDEVWDLGGEWPRFYEDMERTRPGA